MGISESIEDFKRVTLNPYCRNSCEAPCCRFNDHKLPTKARIGLSITEEQVDVFSEASVEQRLVYRIAAGLQARLSSGDFARFYKKAVTKERERLFSERKFKNDPSNWWRHPTEYEYNIQGRCPAHSKTRGCNIYAHEKRPKACSLFPLSLGVNGVFIDERCTYMQAHSREVMEGLLENYPSLTQYERPVTILHRTGKISIFPEEAHQQALEREREMEELLALLSGALGKRVISL